MKNLTMLVDLYQLTMMQVHYFNNRDEKGVYDYFFRRNPFNNGYTIFAGLRQLSEYLDDIEFTDSDIEYLRGLGLFKDEFLDYLKGFKLNCTITCIDEGRVVFPNEPILTVEGSLLEAQFIESVLLNILNHNSLIATKASRIKYVVGDDGSIIELGLRRAQGETAANVCSDVVGIVGFKGTSNVMSGKDKGIDVVGTMAHAFIQSYDNELEAFRDYVKYYPNNAILLVDTYDTLKSGIPNAIQVFKEMKAKGIELNNYGIRLDSGDLAYLSSRARYMLDKEGFIDAKIVASNDLDESIIASLKQQGSKIDIWGIGTSLVTAKGDSALGGVYKLVELGGKPKIKVSENIDKITNPGKKMLYRIIDKESGKYISDYLCLADEVIDADKDLVLTKSNQSYLQKVVQGGSYIVEPMHKVFMCKGKLVYNKESLGTINKRYISDMDNLWGEYKRILNPHIYELNLSDKLYDLKKELLLQARA